MAKIILNANEFSSWDYFHDYFSKSFGFPDWYGRNMNAWIDLMTYLDDPDDSTTTFKIDPSDVLIIEINNCSNLTGIQDEVLQTIIDCCSFVNYRRMDLSERPFILLAYGK